VTYVFNTASLTMLNGDQVTYDVIHSHTAALVNVLHIHNTPVTVFMRRSISAHLTVRQSRKTCLRQRNVANLLFNLTNRCLNGAGWLVIAHMLAMECRYYDSCHTCSWLVSFPGFLSTL